MKLKNSLAALASLFLLTSCEHQHIDENKDHLCDECNMILSEHKDENNDHFCDYCEDQLNGCIDQNLNGKCDICGKDMVIPYEYAEWPTKDVQDLVAAVSGSSVIIPAFLYADDIEIYEDELISRNMFGIFCYTENAEYENQYKTLLVENGFEVSDEKIDYFYEAYDSNWEILINFEYNPEYYDLEIYVTCSDKMKWPENDINKYLNDLVKGTKTTIPAFTAKSYRLNYQPAIPALAINGYEYENGLLEKYTKLLDECGWETYFDENVKENVGISPNKDIKIQYYYTEGINEFNIDVYRYYKPVANWPYDEIAQAITEIGATGEILPFQGNASSFTINWDSNYFAIYIDCPKSDYAKNILEYNQMLENYGYVPAFEMMGETLYAYPGTTLAYHATVLVGVFQIEVMKLSEPAK